MEAFTLLKYWHTLFTTCPTTNPVPGDADDGPYFDLEFSLAQSEAATQEFSDDAAGEADASHTAVRYFPSHKQICPRVSFVHSDPLAANLNGSADITKLPVSLLKSVVKFRMLLVKLRRSKSAVDDQNEDQGNDSDGSVPVEVEQVKGPLVSLFARDTSLQDSGSISKYLKPLKTLYYVEKITCSGPVGFPSGGGAVSLPCTEVEVEAPAHQKQGNSSNVQSGLKVVLKHLGKSRSSSALVAPASRRLDDSLVELQDGIQGAIMHCKRSYSMPNNID